jgi:hypothetical protein
MHSYLGRTGVVISPILATGRELDIVIGDFTLVHINKMGIGKLSTVSQLVGRAILAMK